MATKEQPTTKDVLDALEAAFIALGRLGNNTQSGKERAAWLTARQTLQCAGRLAYPNRGRRQRFSCEYCGGNDETPQDHCMDCERPA